MMRMLLTSPRCHGSEAGREMLLPWQRGIGGWVGLCCFLATWSPDFFAFPVTLSRRRGN